MSYCVSGALFQNVIRYAGILLTRPFFGLISRAEPAFIYPFKKTSLLCSSNVYATEENIIHFPVNTVLISYGGKRAACL